MFTKSRAITETSVISVIYCMSAVGTCGILKTRLQFGLKVCWSYFEHKHWLHFDTSDKKIGSWFIVLFLYPLLLWNVSEFQVIVLQITSSLQFSLVLSANKRLEDNNKKKTFKIERDFPALIMLFRSSWN